MIFPENNINLDKNWFLETRNMGDVVNIPVSLFNQLLNPKLTSYGLTYLKLRYLSQNSYGFFKTTNYKQICNCIGLSKASFFNHIEKLKELQWIKETTPNNFHVVSFHTSAYVKFVKLTTEQIFAVRNSTNTDRTRIEFKERIKNSSNFQISQIKDTTSISLQEFRILLTELSIEIDTITKVNYTKFYDKRVSNKNSENLTSPTKWQRDCSKTTRHIATRYVSKKIGLSIGSITTYRKKASLLKLSSYQKRTFKVKDSKILAHASHGIHVLNDSISKIEIKKAKDVGYFFINKNGELTINQTAYRRSQIDNLRLTGFVRGTTGKNTIRKAKIKKLKSKNMPILEVKTEKFNSIPFCEENFTIDNRKLKSKIKKNSEPDIIPYVALSPEVEKELKLKKLKLIPQSEKTQLQIFEFNNLMYLNLKTFEEDFEYIPTINIDWNTFSIESFERFEELKNKKFANERTEEENKELILLADKLTNLEMAFEPKKGRLTYLLHYFFTTKKVDLKIQEFYFSKKNLI